MLFDVCTQVYLMCTQVYLTCTYCIPVLCNVCTSKLRTSRAQVCLAIVGLFCSLIGLFVGLF